LAQRLPILGSAGDPLLDRLPERMRHDQHPVVRPPLTVRQPVRGGPVGPVRRLRNRLFPVEQPPLRVPRPPTQLVVVDLPGLQRPLPVRSDRPPFKARAQHPAPVLALALPNRCRRCPGACPFPAPDPFPPFPHPPRNPSLPIRLPARKTPPRGRRFHAPATRPPPSAAPAADR